MKRTLLASIVVLLFTAPFASADTFGTGDNQFEIEFVDISGDSGNLGSWSASEYHTFTGVNHNDYRMGMYEVTNDQWTKFKNDYGTVTGSPGVAYNEDPHYTGTHVPTNNVSWYEAAQFVNWLNVSTGKQAAYKFTGTQGTSDYTFTVWDVTDVGYNANNPYRNSNAYYFLPTEDEWIKTAYWNGTNLQTWATVGDAPPTQSGWNFYNGEFATDSKSLWDVGSGTEELNGTFDMMGNVWEWTESQSPFSGDSGRVFRGGSYNQYTNAPDLLRSSDFGSGSPMGESRDTGFRVASVPEPTTLALLAFGGLAVLRKRKK